MPRHHSIPYSDYTSTMITAVVVEGSYLSLNGLTKLNAKKEYWLWMVMGTVLIIRSCGGRNGEIGYERNGGGANKGVRFTTLLG